MLQNDNKGHDFNNTSSTSIQVKASELPVYYVMEAMNLQEITLKMWGSH